MKCIKTKTKIKFLFLPIKFKNKWYWLKCAQITYCMFEGYDYIEGIGATPIDKWRIKNIKVL
jgi:hypothetical protein